MMKKGIAATVMGSAFGLITGSMYGLSQQDFLGGVGMFFAMIVFAYVCWGMIELIVFFSEWISR